MTCRPPFGPLVVTVYQLAKPPITLPRDSECSPLQITRDAPTVIASGVTPIAYSPYPVSAQRQATQPLMYPYASKPRFNRISSRL